MPTPYIEKLLPLCESLYHNALRMAKSVPMGEGKITGPPMLSLALMCRTIGNFHGVVLLLKEGLLVEARVLARCCFENLFMVGGLRAEGNAFVEKMKSDDRAGRKNRLRFIADNPDMFQTISEETRGEMNKAEELLNRFSKPAYLKFKEASQIGPSKEIYLAYSLFSGDAAHPTMTSAFRHFEKDGDDYLFDVEPEPSHQQLDETLHFSCISLLSVMVIITEMHGLNEGPMLVEFNTKVRQLQAERFGTQTVGDGMDIPSGTE